MKKYVLTVIVLAAGVSVFAQKVRLSGKILNTGAGVLKLWSFTGYFTDEVKLNADGTFNYETDQIKAPFRGSLTNLKGISFVLFIAPGYDLQIRADGKDPRTLSKTTAYSGVGAKSNAYNKDYRETFRLDTVQWNTKDVDTFVKHLRENEKVATGLIAKHFNLSNTEPYSVYFKQSL